MVKRAIGEHWSSGHPQCPTTYSLACGWEARSASKFRCCCYSGTGGSCREGRTGLGCFNPLSRAAAGPFSSATWTCCRAACSSGFVSLSIRGAGRFGSPGSGGACVICVLDKSPEELKDAGEDNGDEWPLLDRERTLNWGLPPAACAFSDRVDTTRIRDEPWSLTGTRYTKLGDGHSSNRVSAFSMRFVITESLGNNLRGSPCGISSLPRTRGLNIAARLFESMLFFVA